MLEGITMSIFSQIGQSKVGFTPALPKTLIPSPLFYCEHLYIPLIKGGLTPKVVFFKLINWGIYLWVKSSYRNIPINSL